MLHLLSLAWRFRTLAFSLAQVHPWVFAFPFSKFRSDRILAITIHFAHSSVDT